MDEQVVVLEASIAEVRRLIDRCAAEGVAATAARDACCGGGCAPKAQLVVRREDAARVVQLLEGEWIAALEREGTIDPEEIERLRAAHFGAAKSGSGSGSEEPACPACGHAGALVAGACADCGLQLA